MNQHDRDNLDFILSLTENEFDSWLSTIDADDVEYALELIRIGRQELIEQETELRMEEDGMKLEDAKRIIERVMRKC